MNAGPARSIDLTKNLYHHIVPVRVSWSAEMRFPNHTAGIVRRTGKKMTTKCTNLNPVAIGS